MDNPDMTPEKIFKKGGGQGHVTHAKDTNSKVGMHAHRQSPDMAPEKNSRKRGVARVTLRCTWRRYAL